MQYNNYLIQGANFGVFSLLKSSWVINCIRIIAWNYRIFNSIRISSIQFNWSDPYLIIHESGDSLRWNKIFRRGLSNDFFIIERTDTQCVWLCTRCYIRSPWVSGIGRKNAFAITHSCSCLKIPCAWNMDRIESLP